MAGGASKAAGHVITDGDTSAASITSLPTNIAGMRSVSYTMIWLGTSTPVGVFTVQVSNNWVPTNPNDQSVGAGTWTTLTLDVAPTQPSGGADNTGIDLDGLNYSWVRLVYTRTSGGAAATLQAFVQAKGN